MGKVFRFRFLFLGIAAFLAMIAAFSVAAMLLWNALMPDIFGLPVLNYWQTAGIVILARILFGGLGSGQKRFRPHGRGYGNALREKWQNMSEDERKEFFRERGGFSHFHDFFAKQSNESKKDAPDEGGKSE